MAKIVPEDLGTFTSLFSTDYFQYHSKDSPCCVLRAVFFAIYVILILMHSVQTFLPLVPLPLLPSGYGPSGPMDPRSFWSWAPLALGWHSLDKSYGLANQHRCSKSRCRLSAVSTAFKFPHPHTRPSILPFVLSTRSSVGDFMAVEATMVNRPNDQESEAEVSPKNQDGMLGPASRCFLELSWTQLASCRGSGSPLTAVSTL